MLEGLEEDWTPPTPENYAVYPFIPPGKYTFKVMAVNSDGIWSDSVDTFSFEIRRPFWQTIWFYSICVVLALLLVYMVVRLRFQNLNRSRQRLEQLVADRTAELEEEKDKVIKANQVKSEFLATMSHEIRTPMNGVLGMAELLDRTELDDQQQKFNRNIQISGQNLLAIINDILDFSRIESGKLEIERIPFHMENVVSEVLEVLAVKAHEKELALYYSLDPKTEGEYIGDPGRIKQILVNLIGNAIKFTHKGQIQIRTKFIQTEGEKATIELSVEDSGIGIPADKIDSLFGAFSQLDASTNRKYGGSGLGLAICFRLSKLMGGNLWAESEEGRGAKFTFSVELGTSETSGVPELEAAVVKNKTIWAGVENPVFLEILRQNSSGWGVAVAAGSSLSELESYLTRKDSPDLVLIDVNWLPDKEESTLTRLGTLCAENTTKYLLFCNSSEGLEFAPTLSSFGKILYKPFSRGKLHEALRTSGLTLEAEIAPKAVAAPELLADALALSILVAEDNIVNQEVVRGLLKNYGYIPEIRENGIEVLEAMESMRFDLILMDIQMPEMDGLEATREIIKRYGNANRPRIVAMTANVMESDMQECLDAGMDGFISKPIVVKELEDLIHSFAKNGSVKIDLQPLFRERQANDRAQQSILLSELIGSIPECYPEDGPPSRNWGLGVRSEQRLAPPEPLRN